MTSSDGSGNGWNYEDGTFSPEMVTERIDAKATVIWGARVAESMKGKITVMTIVTGVKSPWILGKVDKMRAAARPTVMRQVDDELGIEIV